MSSLLCLRRLPPSTLFPYTTLFRSHFDHVIDLVGVDYVGIGSDYDGVGDSLPTGLKDVASYPNLVYKLLERGLSDDDIAKILGVNLLRIWEQAMAYAGVRYRRPSDATMISR